jgi:hypothetical protein
MLNTTATSSDAPLRKEQQFQADQSFCPESSAPSSPASNAPSDSFCDGDISLALRQFFQSPNRTYP